MGSIFTPATISSLQLQETSDGMTHDIFLSHSGAQKGFVKDLYKELSRTFSTFFDITHHSLPPGEPFPAHIFGAAKSCKLALVVLSEEFVCSKWPMLELSIFVDAAMVSGLKLLPLFFKLSPADLKHKHNLKRWGRSWKTHAKQDHKHHIDVSKWPHALETLCSQSGLLFQQASEGEQAYIDKVVSAVSQIIPPAFKFDTTFIFGKDRLSKVIVDKFKEMELCESPTSSSTARRPKVSVLGLFGLPGSGKSTLCKCLIDHFMPFYGSTKTLYLELPSTPSHADVVHKLKELLHLTDFRDRVNLDRASDLEHVEHLLKTSHLSSCRVFLVVDNISDKSREMVHRILRLGVGQGSKIILLARTLDVLSPTLDSLKSGLQWACDSRHVPSINEMEATEILLHTARGSLDYKNTLFERDLTLQQIKTVECIVRMCSFDGLQLPLVIKAMGARLLKYCGDLKGWESDVESFWTRVKTYKQSVVIEELVGENFKALLNERLQLLFLDVALFLLQIEKNIEAVSASLSMMHGLSTSWIRMMIKDLERQCFLVVSKDGNISVHDVYLEFAKSIEDGPSKYLSSTISWCWKSCEVVTVAEEGSKLTLEEHQSMRVEGRTLRALVLEVGEGCERVDLQGFSNLKAVLLRNCKSLVVLGLAGLSSLVILEIRNCAIFKVLECNDIDFASVLNVKRWCIQNKPSKPEGKCKAIITHVHEWEQVSYLSSVVNVLKRVFAPFRQPNALIEVGLRMRDLQVLHLQNTGITRLESVGSMWPQLRDLTVIEHYLERLELGSLPQLTQFVFCDSDETGGIRYDLLTDKMEHPNIFSREGRYKFTEMWRRKKGNSRYLLLGKDLLFGCPQLERVVMETAFFKQGQLGCMPSCLVSLEMHFFYDATELPNLSLPARTLQHLDVGWCEKLERLNLDVGFMRLRTIVLKECQNLVEATGLGFLPSLRGLHVSHCMKLQRLIGFDNSELLESFYLWKCPELKEISCLSFLMNLDKLIIRSCPNLERSLARAHDLMICDLEKLRECRVDVRGHICRFSLKNCKHLENFMVNIDAGSLLKLEDLYNVEKLRSLEIWGFPWAERVHERVPKLGLSSVVGFCAGQGIASCCLPSIITLQIGDWDVLDNMDGIQHLRTLEQVYFKGLENLTSLRGLESLIQLKDLTLCGCHMLEELPSLHALLQISHLSIKDCPKLKVVQGCDHMKQLLGVSFDGCKSMECFPFKDLGALSNIESVSFRGCKFASNVEAMAAWAVEEAEPLALREASLSALLWEYYHPHDANNAHKKERVAEAFFASLLRTIVPTDDECLHLTTEMEQFAAWTESWIDEYPTIVMAALQDLEQKVRGKQRRVLLQDIHIHTLPLVRFLDDARVAKLLLNSVWSVVLLRIYELIIIAYCSLSHKL